MGLHRASEMEVDNLDVHYVAYFSAPFRGGPEMAGVPAQGDSSGALLHTRHPEGGAPTGRRRDRIAAPTISGIKRDYQLSHPPPSCRTEKIKSALGRHRRP